MSQKHSFLLYCFYKSNCVVVQSHRHNKTTKHRKHLDGFRNNKNYLIQLFTSRHVILLSDPTFALNATLEHFDSFMRHDVLLLIHNAWRRNIKESP